MIRSLWMNAWDLEGMEPDAIIDSLLDLQIDECRLGLAYHGGRMLLPRNARHVVYEQHASAVYFSSDNDRYGRLQPVCSPLAQTVEPFLETCARRHFPVQAWTVLCHNDRLGTLHPGCCIENAFGEPYSYALCPAHPDVQQYIIALCEEIAALPGITMLDLEALSFMGYQHASLHDKSGIGLPSEITRLLSICFCPYCRPGLPDAEIVRQSVRDYFASGRLPKADSALDTAVLNWRRRTLRRLLTHLATVPINLRFTPDDAFTGGKTALPWADVTHAVAAVTLTFFGSTIDQMHEGLAKLPQERPARVDAGFMFHLPDCKGKEDISRRLELIEQAAVNGVSFYCYSMAAKYQLDWLRCSIKESLS